jgi:hypothetical protein
MINNKGIKNPAYIDGRTLRQHYCSCGNKICLANYFCGSGLCRSCSCKGKNNGNYKNGKAMNKNEYYKEYNKQKRNNDINFRLLWNLRWRIYSAIKNNFKSISTIKLIGCNIEFLKQHLEKQFTKGMTWKNYGDWHIDHILPCYTFDLSKKSEQLKCFNYKNLRPLWAEENLRRPKKEI